MLEERFQTNGQDFLYGGEDIIQILQWQLDTVNQVGIIHASHLLTRSLLIVVD